MDRLNTDTVPLTVLPSDGGAAFVVRIDEQVFFTSVEIIRPTQRHPQPVDGMDRDAGEGRGQCERAVFAVHGLSPFGLTVSCWRAMRLGALAKGLTFRKSCRG